ncbi:YybH family protein [Kribbella kalugense]|uniref:Ketosteroid isomerase-like protein n=1 Tax=Kribbella kalugense TaxID=2512221 RepID=A0A4R8A000_9ACTN|nr:nuclear transport factor 2 family protein [Kribbella kalugense]TDW22568.1 ketosteroid isomerase-like protein [Kribbella kalugense]
MTTDNATQNALAEVDIRERIESLLDAVRTGDLETLKTIFAPNIVSFDIEAPLRHLGAEKKAANWKQVFTMFQLPLEYETRDLTVLVDGNLAVVYSLNHMNASLSNGGKIDYWLRWTSAWQKIDGQWMVVHDQVSVPTYFPEGRAAMDLTP